MKRPEWEPVGRERRSASAKVPERRRVIWRTTLNRYAAADSRRIQANAAFHSCGYEESSSNGRLLLFLNSQSEGILLRASTTASARSRPTLPLRHGRKTLIFLNSPLSSFRNLLPNADMDNLIALSEIPREPLEFPRPASSFPRRPE